MRDDLAGVDNRYFAMRSVKFGKFIPRIRSHIVKIYSHCSLCPFRRCGKIGKAKNPVPLPWKQDLSANSTRRCRNSAIKPAKRKTARGWFSPTPLLPSQVRMYESSAVDEIDGVL